MKYKILILSLLSSIFTLHAQHPFSVKWDKIDTKNFEIVFPEKLFTQGQNLAQTLEFLYQPISSDLLEEPKKISIFLSNQSVISNGYISTIPRMGLFYTTPMQDATILGSTDWLKTLAIHEFRHVVQNDLSNKRFTRLGNIFYGSYGRAGLAYSEPLWYSEGDAVLAETMYSKQGRGRLSAFYMPIKAQLLSQNNYKYENTYLGSYKNYTPNHYATGFLMELDLTNKFGKNITYKTINRMSAYSFLPNAFSLAQKKETGKNARQMYHFVFENYKKNWLAEIAQIQEDSVIYLTKTSKIWNNFTFPFKVENFVYAIQYGLDSPSKLVRIDSMQKVHEIKKIDTEKLSASNDKIVWSETVSDLRWTEKSYSDIFVFDIKTQKIIRLTTKKRYFAPAISPNSKYIACVEFDENSKSKILILNTLTGLPIKEFSLPENDFIRTPAWSENTEELIFMHTSKNGQAMSICDFKTNKIRNILPYSYNNISNPVFYNDKIIFNFSVSDNDKICVLDTVTKDFSVLITRKFGVFNASINDKTLVFQDYTAKGFQIAEIELNKLIQTNVDSNDFYVKALINKNLEDIDTTLILANFNALDSNYVIKKYNRFANVLNFHAWGLYPHEETIDFTLTSNNKLNTLTIEAGIGYKKSNETFRKYIEIENSALFPVFHFGFDTENKTIVFYENEVKNEVNWQENHTTFGMYFPFNFSKGSLVNLLTFGTHLQITQNIGKQSVGNYSIREGIFSPITFYGVYQLYSSMAKRDVAPRNGLYIKALYRKTLLNQEFTGWQKFFFAKLYLPSLLKHHSLRLEGAIELKESDLMFANQFIYPRGFEVQQHELFIKQSVNYHFPLFYPDLNLVQLLYIKRVRTNLFYDYGFFGKVVTYEGESLSTISSIGLEVFFDFNFFNLKYDFNSGFRISHRINDKKNIYEFIMFEIPIK